MVVYGIFNFHFRTVFGSMKISFGVFRLNFFKPYWEIFKVLFVEKRRLEISMKGFAPWVLGWENIVKKQSTFKQASSALDHKLLF